MQFPVEYQKHHFASDLIESFDISQKTCLTFNPDQMIYRFRW